MTVRQRYVVRGMTCEHCVTAVSAELSRLPGVRAVEVAIESGGVTVDSDASLPEEQVQTAVDGAGYELAPREG